MMPTVRALRRKKRQPQPDPDKPPSYVLISTAAPSPPPDPETLPMSFDRKGRAQGMRYAREKLYAWSMAARFFDWLILFAAYKRVPLDDVLTRLEGLAACLEIHLMAAVTWPDLFPREPAEEDEPDDAPATEADAIRHGLSIVPPRKPGVYLPVPSLPGCHGTPDGKACQSLRRFGAKFCPACERRERQRLRAIRAGL